MKTLLFLSVLLLFISFAPPANKNVYICNRPNGKRFHFKEDCKGLQACTHKIEKVTLEEARKAGKTACGYEK